MPKVSLWNIRKASRHPILFYSLLRGNREGELAKKHIAIHLRQVTKIRTVLPAHDPIETVCQAIDLSFNDCYHTQYLYFVARHFQPRKFVETGVYYGASSAFILLGLKDTDGRLYSIDLPNISYTRDNGIGHEDVLPEASGPGFVVPQSLRCNWTLRLGNSRAELPKLLEEIGPIDIFHHDSSHTYEVMSFEFETAFKYIRPGGLLLADDAEWSGAFVDFCKKYSLQHRVYKHIGVAVK